MFFLGFKKKRNNDLNSIEGFLYLFKIYQKSIKSIEKKFYLKVKNIFSNKTNHMASIFYNYRFLKFLINFFQLH